MANDFEPVPLYHRVKVDILDKLNKDIYSVGTIIPSETELQEIYNVSRITIRQAIEQLVNEGYLVKKQGKGTFVKEKKFTQELNYITNWNTTMKELGKNPHTKNINISEVLPPSFVEKALNINPGGKVYKIERLRYAEDEPICVMVNYLVPKFVPGLLENGLIGESLYETLKNKYNIVFSSAIETVEAKAAKKELAELLNVKRGFPVLQATRVTYDINNEPFEVVVTISRSDKYSYTIHLVEKQM